MGDEIKADAEVIEDGGQLAVTYVPARISANFDVLEASVREVLSDFEGAQYDLTSQDAINDAKRHRSYLNGIANQIDERRKAVKREYMRPYDEFDSRARAIVGLVNDVSGNIKEQLDEAEEARKEARLQELKDHYGEFAGLLAPVVPYERFHDKRWLNKTCPLRKAEDELDGKVDKLAQDWETLKSALSGSEFYDVGERELFATLDLGKAIAAESRAKAEAERIAALRAAVEGSPEPEPANASKAPLAPAEDGEEPVDWVIELRATRSQARAAAAQLKAIGLTGHIRTANNS